MRIYDLPESVLVFSGHCLPFKGDLECLVGELEPVDSDLWKSRFHQLLVYRLLKVHQLLRSRQSRSNRESRRWIWIFNPLRTERGTSRETGSLLSQDTWWLTVCDRILPSPDLLEVNSSVRGG